MGPSKFPIFIAVAGATLFAAAATADDDPTKVRDYYAPTYNELRHVSKKNDAVVGIVEKMAGPCFVNRQGTGGNTSISIGLRVFEKDVLVTGETSRLNVRYKDGTYVELGGSSQFQVSRVRFNPPNLLPANKAQDQLDESYFVFDHGIVRITAPDIHSQERFNVRTQLGIVSVAGPSDFYLVQLEGDRDMTIRVTKGKIGIMNIVTNETMAVPERTGAYVKISGSVSSAGAFTDEQLNFLRSRTHI